MIVQLLVHVRHVDGESVLFNIPFITAVRMQQPYQVCLLNGVSCCLSHVRLAASSIIIAGFDRQAERLVALHWD